MATFCMPLLLRCCAAFSASWSCVKCPLDYLLTSIPCKQAMNPDPQKKLKDAPAPMKPIAEVVEAKEEEVAKEVAEEVAEPVAA